MESHTRSAFADLCVSWLFIRIALVYPADAFAGMADEIRSFHQVARALCPGHVSLYLEVPLGASDGPVFLSIAGTAPWMDGVDSDFTFFCIGFLGWLDPVTELTMIAVLTTVIAFLSSSQDIVVDAFRRELLPDEEQGLGSAIHVNAYRVSGMVPGALSLILADMMSWSGVFWVTAAFMLPGLLCTLVISEPKIHGAPPKTIREAVVLPFTEFIGRAGWKSALFILSFIFLYKLGDSLATALATKFYLDLGFSMTQIGVIAKTTGFWASLIGGLLGGIWIIGLGINRALWVFGAVQALAILGFSWMSLEGPNPVLLAAVIGFEAFGVSLGTAAFVAYIATTTDERYTATQFALFTSLAAVPRTFINASAGYIVDQTGWFMFFNLCFILALPGMLLLPQIAPWRQKRHLAQEQ